MADDPAASPSPASHLYGGQAVVEGVMMRGARHWAVAVRRPSGDIHLESHGIDSVADRHPVLRKPFLRGVIVLGQSLAIGMRALMIASNQSVDDEEQLSSKQIGVSLSIALLLFVGVFILGPTALFTWVEGRLKVGRGVPLLVAEGIFRVMLFVGYLWLIGRTKDIHRVFEYHGAEHKTIAAYEHGEELVPEKVDRFPKEHVRCGTNFLIIVMVITIFVFTLFGTPGLLWRVGSRIVAIPIIAGLAYEALRLGAKFPGSLAMRALMAPGIWLQKITTQRPDDTQIEVAIASFDEVLRREEEEEAAGAS
ncbi:MAG: DUF1385 domain-containing protein [Actinomycetota bacterium]|nr:DUF1385 domain-containing protein [Actinomycetota bacterium]